MPLVLRLRGSKRLFRSATRTLDRVAKLQSSPASFTPPRLSGAVEVVHGEFRGWPVFTITPRDGGSGSRAVFLHGGCYVFEIDSVHWRFLEELAIESGATMVVPIMPLAPSGTASVVVPAIADLVASAIDEVGADNISVMGDSSGGGMALAVAMELRDRGSAPLRRIVLSAPWLDISGTDPRLTEIEPSDPWLALPGTHAAGALYRAELSESDWRVSPIHGDFAGLGPITLFSGTRDILNADAHRLLLAAERVGVDLDFHEGEEMVHNYPILPIAEGYAARTIIAEAIR